MTTNILKVGAGGNISNVRQGGNVNVIVSSAKGSVNVANKNIVNGAIFSSGNVHIGDNFTDKNTVRVLTVGDLHYQEDPTLPTLLNKKIDKILAGGQYDCCILLGDILHRFKNIDQPAQSLVTDLFDIITSHCPLFVLVGNHDYINATQFLTDKHSLLPFKRWPRIKIIDTPQIVKFSTCKIALVPYVPKGQFLEALETSATKGKWENVDMIFAHQEFKGCKMGGVVSVDGDCWSDKFPPVISGHCHTKHIVGENIIYIGMPYDLGYESEERFVAEVIFKNDGKNKINYIPTGLPKKQLLRLSLDEAKKWAPEGTDYYKLKIICTKEEFRHFSKSAHAKDLRMAGVKLVHVSMDDKKAEEILQKKQGCQTYREIFQKLVTDEGLGEIVAKIF